jgi:hypothetical protein
LAREEQSLLNIAIGAGLGWLSGFAYYVRRFGVLGAAFVESGPLDAP